MRVNTRFVSVIVITRGAPLDRESYTINNYCVSILFRTIRFPALKRGDGAPHER